jgi:pimeloyl-ACP methyl ester carboxylesterase
MTHTVPVVVTSVATAAGELRALVHNPGRDGLLPGVVLVDGSGEGTADGWGQWPAAIAGCGAVVLAHDKPGCGGSPGDWREQTLQDRAIETLAAAEVLRAQPGVDRGRVGLLGISQGGWVAYLAASLEPERISQLVNVSGPGVSPVEQERFRIACATGDDAEALAWVDERMRRIGAGEDPASIIAAQRAYADRPWFAATSEHYDDPGFLGFVARNLGFDPATVLPEIRCRVFAAFGGADTSVPVARSAAILSQLLPANPRHALAIFPGGDHNLFVTERDENTPLGSQLAPGFMPMLDAWLNAT